MVLNEEDFESSDDSSLKVEDDEVKKSSEKETDVESLRKVIKLDPTDKVIETTDDDTLNKTDDSVNPNNANATDGDLKTIEPSENKQEILDSIRNLDNQIKGNIGNINNLNQKMDILTKDIDDLVSLYEIVSDQMNPFVGLSKVTKKRIDALENFIKQVEGLQTRIGELESFAERSGAKFENLENIGASPEKTIDVDMILGGTSEDSTSDNGHDNEIFNKESQQQTKETPSEIPDIKSDKIFEKTIDVSSLDDKIDILLDEVIDSLIDSNDK